MKINKSVKSIDHVMSSFQPNLTPIVKFFEILLEWDRESNNANKSESRNSTVSNKKGAK